MTILTNDKKSGGAKGAGTIHNAGGSTVHPDGLVLEGHSTSAQPAVAPEQNSAQSDVSTRGFNHHRNQANLNRHKLSIPLNSRVEFLKSNNKYKVEKRGLRVPSAEEQATKRKRHSTIEFENVKTDVVHPIAKVESVLSVPPQSECPAAEMGPTNVQACINDVSVAGAEAEATDSASTSAANACNSEDEYEGASGGHLTEEEMIEREKRFELRMKKKGLLINPMGEDGACLFRAVSDQIYGDQEMHSQIRKHCMDYIALNRDYFSQYMTEDVNDYVRRKRLNHVHGNHIEIQAISEMYNRTIEVFCYRSLPITTFHGSNNGTPQTNSTPIRLSYHKGVHYNSLIDPNNRVLDTVRSLPNLVPGLADRNMEKEAKRQSEEFQLEQAMLEDKLRATDWEATNEAISEQVARESYLEWLQDNERLGKKSPTPSSSSAVPLPLCSERRSSQSPKSRSRGGRSPKDTNFDRFEPNLRCSPPKTTTSPIINPRPRSPPGAQLRFAESLSFVNQLPPELFGLSEEYEDQQGIMAQVLAESQQEYLDSLKSNLDSQPQPQPQCSTSKKN